MEVPTSVTKNVLSMQQMSANEFSPRIHVGASGAYWARRPRGNADNRRTHVVGVRQPRYSHTPCGGQRCQKMAGGFREHHAQFGQLLARAMCVCASRYERVCQRRGV
jgi:hypothetical protein